MLSHHQRAVVRWNAAMYMKRLAKLNQWSLEERRNRSDLIEVFKMAKNLSPIPLTQILRIEY